MRPVSRQSAEAGDRLVSAMVLTSPREHVWQPDEVLVFDNWRLLHGRPRVSRADLGNRRLERLLWVTRWEHEHALEFGVPLGQDAGLRAASG